MEKETQMYRTEFWTLWEKARVGCFERTASKQVYYQGWNRSPAQAGCMRQVLGPGALGRPRGIGRRGRWEGESGWGIHVNPWLIHVNVWQKPLQYCKVISLQQQQKKLWYIYTMEYYSAIKKNAFESVLMRWMKLEPIIQNEVSQKDKDQYSILTHIYGILKDGNNNSIHKTEKET